ncbi:hypothetical protein FHW88_005261 [Mucilaginibacter sp. SG538B]|uniref:hypothetical protein n=1 Tax=Mucilaginibacter sp. SG538B TaxID=2587021 RepID=UPI00159EB33A|nr:hypothetical protein [Mucilaginibacter sp. SG538B]NVM66943.1 hypothetical protein [Mucilaginibacter sp. SG538B]
MDKPEHAFFKSESRISPVDIVLRYGKINPWELYFKLAEHKNFEAAKAVFDRWDDDFVKESDRYLITRFVHSEWAKEERPLYIAHCYLMKLIRDRNVRDEWAVEEDDEEDVKTLRRLSGILPRIDIDGHDFIVDWKLREMREAANPANKIDIRQMEATRFNDGYMAFYHMKDKALVTIPGDITVLPENVMLLRIPHELKLDPLAAALDRGFDELALLNGNPVRESLKAEFSELKYTDLPEIIERNLQGIRAGGIETVQGRKKSI